MHFPTALQGSRNGKGEHDGAASDAVGAVFMVILVVNVP